MKEKPKLRRRASTSAENAQRHPRTNTVGWSTALIGARVKNFGKMLKDEWLNDGSWLGVIEIPGGLETELYENLNNATKGEVETKVVKTR